LKFKWVNQKDPVLEAPDRDFLNYVISQYGHFLSSSLKKACEKLGLSELNLSYEINQEALAPIINGGDPLFPPTSSTIINTQIPISKPHNYGTLNFNTRFTFDNFVVGQSNDLAFHAAKALSSGNNLMTNILYLTADHGLGKSHLAQAAGHSFIECHPETKIYYLSAEDFLNEMIVSIKNNKMEDLKRKYRQEVDILVLEEVSFLGGKEKVQEEICYTLDILENHGKKIIMTSILEPNAIPGLASSLRSRMRASLIAPISAPNFETRLGILLRRANQEGLKIGRPILEQIADAVQNDVRQLESCLISILVKARYLNQPVTKEMADDSLQFVSQTANDNRSVGKVLKVVSENFHLNEDDLKSKSRKRILNEARSVGMYLARLLTRNTYEEIGIAFGRNHSTVLYSINKIEQKMKKDVRLKSMIEFLTNQLSRLA
jgi:chromosomal replication initiator protein